MSIYDAPRPWNPHDYQRKAIKFLMEHGAAGLFLDPGLGKTSITLGAILLLKRMKVMEKVLVIAPLRVCYSVWPGEARKWKDFEELRVAVLHGPRKDEALASDADIYCINPEGLEWLRDQDAFKKFDTLVVDESSKFKHTSTRRYKVLRPYLPKFKRRWILTGTPAPNGLLDLFGQVYIMDLGNSLGRYITHYRMKYFDSSGFGGYTWTLKPGADRLIYGELAPYVMRLEAKDFLELPRRIDNHIKVTLPPDAARVYKEVEKKLLAELMSGEEITAMTAAAKSIKCRQVASGSVYVDGKDWAPVHPAKLDAVEALVEDLNGSPLLIAFEFQHELERLLERFPNAPYISGGVSPRRSEEIADSWNRGEIPVLLGQPQSMGHGLNLQGDCGHICWFSLTWDLELYQQLIQRVLRQGNTKQRVVVHHILAENTIDEVMLSVLHGKDRTQNALLLALKDYARDKVQRRAG